jgi:hypothetical protein
MNLIKLLDAILTEMDEVTEPDFDTTNCISVGVPETIPIARDKAGQHSIAQFRMVKNATTCPTSEGE